MNNKNKFSIVLNILMVFILLNSCEGGLNGINGTNTNSSKGCMDTKMKDAQAACPNCKEGSRFLYKVATDKENNIILICEECNAIWLDPRNIEWDNTTSDKTLKSEFNVKDPESLFDETSSGWATKKDAENSGWGDLVRNNELLVK